MRHSQSLRRVHLGFRNGEDAGSVVLGFAGPVIQPKPQDRGDEWIETHSQMWQSVEDQEELDQERSAPEYLDV